MWQPEIDDFVNSVMAETALTEGKTITLTIGSTSVELPTHASGIFHILEAVSKVLKEG